MHQNTESANVTDWFHNRTYRMPFISQKHEQNGVCQITASNFSNDGLKTWLNEYYWSSYAPVPEEFYKNGYWWIN